MQHDLQQPKLVALCAAIAMATDSAGGFASPTIYFLVKAAFVGEVSTSTLQGSLVAKTWLFHQ